MRPRPRATRATRAQRVTIACALVAAVWAVATSSQAAPGSTSVQATVASTTTVDPTGCTSPDALRFDALTADSFTILDTCRIGFGGTAPTDLRIWQRDEHAPALETDGTFNTLRGSTTFYSAASTSPGRAWLGGQGGPGEPSGFLTHTTDGGGTWQQQTPCIDQRIVDISAVSDDIAYLTTGSRICRTLDGGDTWTLAYWPAQVLPRIKMIDATTGWAVSTAGGVLHTTNGTTWNLQYTDPVLTNLIGIDATPDGRISIAGSRSDATSSDYGALTSNDGGATWSRSIHTSTAGRDTYGAGGVLRINATTTLVGHRFGIYRTTNSGATWALVSPGLSLINNPERMPDGTIIAAAAPNVFRRSTNDGATWSNVSMGVSTNNAIRDFAVTSDTEVWAAGTGDLRLRTTDATASWQSLGGTHPGLRGIVSWDADRWLVAGDLGRGYRTLDGGATLPSITVGTTNHVRDGIGAPGGVGVMVGDGGTIVRSTDYGATWAAVTSPAAVGWAQIVRDERGVMWVAGSSGRVASSSDAGATWTLHATVPGSPSVTSIAANDGVVWVGTSAGAAWKSGTAAVAWSAVATGAGTGLVGAWVIDSETIVFVAAYGVVAGTSYVMRTTDGGATWATRPLPLQFTYGLTPNDLIDPRRAWISSTSGSVIKTEDGGDTWTLVPAPPYMQNLNRVMPIDANRLIAAGDNGTLARSMPSASIPDDIPASGSGFGACLASTTGTSATSWPVTGAGNCTTSAPIGVWQPIAERPTDAGALVASTATSATVDLNFGVRISSNQRAGAYRAEIKFEAIAP
ncbi:MAG: putative photosystem stability/assembly factor-like protein [Thermoleophilia bacterium]|nr:putative photosystem stability/assembly factor-like protein [Thermoleophilia bacterium]